MSSFQTPYFPNYDFKVYRFSPGDHVERKNITYRWVEEARNGHFLQQTVGSVAAEFFTHQELSLMFHSGEMGYLPRKRAGSDGDANVFVSRLSPNERTEIFHRAEFCKRFLRRKLVGGKEGEAISSDDEDIRKEIQGEIIAEMRERHLAAGKKIKTLPTIPPYPTGRRLREWVEKFKSASGDPTVFIRKKASKTGRRSIFGPEVNALIQKHMNEFASRDKLKQKTAFERFEDAIKALETERKELAALMGLPEPTAFRKPGITAFTNRIRSLPRAYIDRGRLGAADAAKIYDAVGSGLDAIKPLEYLQIDETWMDVITILEIGDVWKTLTDKEKALVARVRLYITAVICVATKCILGMKIHHSPPSSASVLAALEMVSEDKIEIAHRLGCQMRWAMRGNLGTVMTDSAAWYESDITRAAIVDAGGTVFHLRAGDAPGKGSIERWFRTQSNSVAEYWGGRTWGGPEQRGSDPIPPNLCFDQASALFYRYVVDVYHHLPHHALLNESPSEAWDRLNKIHKPTPPLSQNLSRNVFGHRVKRKLTTAGIRFLGINYQSIALQGLFRQSDIEVWIFVKRSNLGAISVEYKGDLLTVPAVEPEFEGMSVWMWMSLVRRLKLDNKNRTSVSRLAVREAEAYIRREGRIGRAEAELGSAVLTPETYEKWEKKLNHSIDFTDDIRDVEANVRDMDDVIGFLAELDERDPSVSPPDAQPHLPPRDGGESGRSQLNPDFNR